MKEKEDILTWKLAVGQFKAEKGLERNEKEKEIKRTTNGILPVVVRVVIITMQEIMECENRRLT